MPQPEADCMQPQLLITEVIPDHKCSSDKDAMTRDNHLYDLT